MPRVLLVTGPGQEPPLGWGHPHTNTAIGNSFVSGSSVSGRRPGQQTAVTVCTCVQDGGRGETLQTREPPCVPSTHVMLPWVPHICRGHAQWTPRAFRPHARLHTGRLGASSRGVLSEDPAA